MWIVKNDSFLSIVEDRNDETRLLVRGRIKGDIEAVFPAAKVETTPSADYLYRAFLPRAEVKTAIAECIDSIDYPNFKGSVKSITRHEIYMKLWEVMHKAQQMLSKV
jgi:chorismate mutase